MWYGFCVAFAVAAAVADVVNRFDLLKYFPTKWKFDVSDRQFDCSIEEDESKLNFNE